jgi:hypothetical protein
LYALQAIPATGLLSAILSLLFFEASFGAGVPANATVKNKEKTIKYKTLILLKYNHIFFHFEMI